MARQKISWYRIQTPCKNMQFFDNNQSETWQALLATGGKNKNFGVDITGRVRIPEEQFTEQMAEEAWVDETDSDGIIDVDFDDKDKAKFIMRKLRCFAGLPGVHVMAKLLNAKEDGDKTLGEELAIRELKFYNSLLHKDSPRDIIDDLAKEIQERGKMKPRTKYAAVEKTKKDPLVKKI